MNTWLAEQSTALMNWHSGNKDTVLLMLAATVSVNAIQEFLYYEADPMTGGTKTTKKTQLRFPVLELNGAIFQEQFDIGDRCYIGPPVKLIPAGTFDQAKWELKYYRVSADGVWATAGLDCND